MRNAVDRFMGWITVTIVGFLTAITAFLIVRSEQWLLDIKYGYCVSGWWKARRFCCPVLSDARTFALGASTETCSTWLSWGEAFAGPRTSHISQTLVDRASYLLLAVRRNVSFALRIADPPLPQLLLALVSSILTINLTASTLFVTRKYSGVLSPNFASPSENHKISAPPSDPPAKRKVLHYAAGRGIPEIKTILSGVWIMSAGSGRRHSF